MDTLSQEERTLIRSLQEGMRMSEIANKLGYTVKALFRSAQEIRKKRQQFYAVT